MKAFFEQIKWKVSPDPIFTYYREDRHQDHRMVSELTWSTFRDHSNLEYHVPKFDGDFGASNLFVHLDERTCRRKVRNILAKFASQRGRRWFTEELFRSVLRLRGMESNAPDQYAEGLLLPQARPHLKGADPTFARSASWGRPETST